MVGSRTTVREYMGSLQYVDGIAAGDGALISVESKQQPPKLRLPSPVYNRGCSSLSCVDHVLRLERVRDFIPLVECLKGVNLRCRAGNTRLAVRRETFEDEVAFSLSRNDGQSFNSVLRLRRRPGLPQYSDRNSTPEAG